MNISYRKVTLDKIIKLKKLSAWLNNLLKIVIIHTGSAFIHADDGHLTLV